MSHQAKSPDQYRVIFHQDAIDPLMSAHVPKMTPDALLDYSVRQFAHLPIDCYASDANHASGCDYHTKVADVNLSGRSHFRGQQDVRLIDALQALFDAGTDPLEVMCEGTHAADKDFMIRLRMNDLHDVVGVLQDLETRSHRPTDTIGEPIYYTSKWKKEHPELLIGDPTDDTPPVTYSYFQRSAMNYALGAVRQLTFAMAKELVTGYDLDFLELDFIRFAFFFHRAEAYAQRHVMTELVRRIRGLCEEEGKRRGRPVRLSARVPDTLELGLRCGLDTAVWLSDGLLDMVTIGGGYTNFGTPWQEIAGAARDVGVPAMACLNAATKASTNDIRQIRAAAHRAHAAGVTGIKIWNCFYHLPYHHPKEGKPSRLEFTRELADPDCLGKRELTYAVDSAMNPDKLLGGRSHFHHAWPGQLPMTIGLAGDGIGQRVTFDIPEEAAGREPGDEATLLLELGNFWIHDDRLELYWNGQPMEGADYEMRRQFGTERYWVTYSLPCSSIRKGLNSVELRLVYRDPRVDPFVALWRAELTVPERSA